MTKRRRPRAPLPPRGAPRTPESASGAPEPVRSHSGPPAGTSRDGDAPTIAWILRDLPPGWTEVAPPVLPAGFELKDAKWFVFGPLGVCASIEDCGPDGLWFHTSVSRKDGHLPTWEQLVKVKEALHGDRLVIQVLPPRSEYVNLYEVLHLWERLDAPTLPRRVIG